MFPQKLLFVLIIFGMVLSCNRPSAEESQRTLTLENAGLHNQLIIRNDGDKLAKFSLDINDKGLNNFDDVIAHVTNMKADIPNEGLERKAWRFVIEKLQYSIPLSFDEWAQNPLVVLNSIGSGYSGDHAILLFNIWRHLGFESRIWNLNGHDVAEVKIDGKWQMYDSTYEIYYLNSQNKIAGVRELIENPKLITHPILKTIPILPDDLHSIYNFAYRHSSHFATLYTSEEDNIKSAWVKKNQIIDQIFLELPPKATLTFPAENSEPMVMKNEYGLEKIFSDCIKLSLTEPWSGKMEIPLYLSVVAGEGKIVLNQNELDLMGGHTALYPEKNTSFPQVVEVREIKKTLDLFYLFNKDNISLISRNKIELNGRNIDALAISTTCTSEDSNSNNSNATMMYDKIDEQLEYLAFFEDQKDFLYEDMFSEEHPITSSKDIEHNIDIFFLGTQNYGIGDSAYLKESLVKSLNSISDRLTSEKKVVFYKLLSDARFFAAMVQIADSKSSSFLEDYLLGLLQY